MSPGPTRRQILASAAALPWLVSCHPGTSTQGVDLLEGTFSSRFWKGQEVRWRLAQPAAPAKNTKTADKGAGRQPHPLVVALHGHGGDASLAFDGIHIERHVAQTAWPLWPSTEATPTGTRGDPASTPVAW